MSSTKDENIFPRFQNRPDYADNTLYTVLLSHLIGIKSHFPVLNTRLFGSKTEQLWGGKQLYRRKAMNLRVAFDSRRNELYIFPDFKKATELITWNLETFSSWHILDWNRICKFLRLILLIDWLIERWVIISWTDQFIIAAVLYLYFDANFIRPPSNNLWTSCIIGTFFLVVSVFKI